MVIVSSDTTRSFNLMRNTTGAVVLVHEGQSKAMLQAFAHALAQGGGPGLAKVIGQVGNYHATPQQAAAEADEANVRLLVFTHIGPIAPDNWILRQIFARGVTKVRPSSKWMLGFDGFTLDLSIGSNVIEQGKVN